MEVRRLNLIIAIILVIALLLSIFGCGGGGGDTPPDGLATIKGQVAIRESAALTSFMVSVTGLSIKNPGSDGKFSINVDPGMYSVEVANSPNYFLYPVTSNMTVASGKVYDLGIITMNQTSIPTPNL